MLRFVIKVLRRELSRSHPEPRKRPRQHPVTRSTPSRIHDQATPRGRALPHRTPCQTASPAQWKRPDHIPLVLSGKCYVEDGDTIKIKGFAIRLAGIDAPELDHPYGKKSMWAMRHLCKGQIITAHVTDEMSYNRVVATCFLPDGRDLAAELVKQGLAIDWPKFSGGKYRALETADARKKMWRAVARQQGRYRPGI
ncbi:MAG: thermonuclease family protein [Pseudomonadota bacterium]